jgi:hypothetical protein
MRRWAIVAAAVTVTGCGHMPGGGWTTLVDGERGLENFNRVGDANWRAENGVIMADHGKGGYLVSKNTYRDFEIRAEFWADAETNSGVFIRCADPAKIGGATCYEVNVWDVRPEPKYGTGAIVDVAAVPVPPVYKAGGRWNTYEIRAKGTELTVRLNGVQTVSVRDTKHASGPVALQYGPGLKGAESAPIKWRKVEIRPL